MRTLHPPLPTLFVVHDTATTAIYTLSLHVALPISYWAALALRWALRLGRSGPPRSAARAALGILLGRDAPPDRKSTRLNSSHTVISYAVLCLKKKRKR